MKDEQIKLLKNKSILKKVNFLLECDIESLKDYVDGNTFLTARNKYNEVILEFGESQRFRLWIEDNYKLIDKLFNTLLDDDKIKI